MSEIELKYLLADTNINCCRGMGVVSGEPEVASQSMWPTGIFFLLAEGSSPLLGTIVHDEARAVSTGSLAEGPLWDGSSGRGRDSHLRP